ncbi:MAG: ABC transporter permease [Pyrobaculum sp.]
MIRNILSEVISSTLGKAGLGIIAILAVLSMVVIITTPGDIVQMWNSPQNWQYNPRIAMPEWVNYFGLNLPKTEIIELKPRMIRPGEYQYSHRLRWDYSATPSEVYIEIISQSENALVTLQIKRPDGVEIKLLERTIIQKGTIRINIDTDREVRRAVISALGDGTPSELIFSKNGHILRGTYEFSGALYSFDGGQVIIRLVLYGRVHGLAGTDDLRRDIFLGMMFGIPIAFIFGIATAFTTAFIQAIFGILAGWYGRKVDVIIDRLSDINLLLPFLPVLITITIFIGRLTLEMLFYVIVLLNLFGSITKAVRSMVMQLKHSLFVEAAKIAGAGNFWIMTRHILPMVLPFAFANAVISVPSFVYLEAALSLIGFGDPFLPTLGKILERSFAQGALYSGYWWWILSPSIVLILITLGFALFGYALDQAVNPRLKRQ